MATKPYIAVAPMMDWTDRHCRYFHRLISPNTRLFSEMVTTGALIHGDRERFLRFSEAEHPVILQLGGSDPADLAECARMGEDAGYDEINLNNGCPSDRVQSGRFGACLMAEPDLVAQCVEKMVSAVSVPVTVKCRIAIDHFEDFSFLDNYIRTVSQAGCQEFTVHARKAWLSGLSPKENREIPPLRYDVVQEIKDKYPALRIIVNGGINTAEETERHLAVFDGVMIGREAYKNPYLLAELEQRVFLNDATHSRDAIALAMIPYAEEQNRLYGTPVKSISRHMLGLFQGKPGARQWRRYLSENAFKPEATADIFSEALEAMNSRQRQAA